MTQELKAGAKSSYFNSNIPVDTSNDSVANNDYVVSRGDSIWSVSQKFGLSDSELASANNMTTTTMLYPGQTLKIPVHNIAVKSTPGAQYGEVLDWFTEARYLFPIGKTGKVTDIASGKSFMVKRTMGASHSDTEPLTAGDTAIMKDIFGGSWSWKIRPFILETDGRRFAVSISGMPHAGVDGVPYLQNVDNRSGNYGYGPNDDTISGNGMDGHFDLYFLNCLRHVDNKLDPEHQYNVLLAGGLQ
jgi:LysM repeat protein